MVTRLAQKKKVHDKRQGSTCVWTLVTEGVVVSDIREGKVQSRNMKE